MDKFNGVNNKVSNMHNIINEIINAFVLKTNYIFALGQNQFKITIIVLVVIFTYIILGFGINHSLNSSEFDYSF